MCEILSFHLLTINNISDIVVNTIGWCSLANWAFLICLFAVSRYRFDRWIAKGSMMVLVYMAVLVLSIPFLIFAVVSLWEEHLIDERTMSDGTLQFLRYFYNPFVNPGSLETRDLSQTIISVLGILLLSGLMVSLLVNTMEQRANKWRKGELYYHFGRGLLHRLHLKVFYIDFCIVIGGHTASLGLIAQLVSQYKRIIIFSSRNIEEYRREVESVILREKDRNRLVFYYGSRTSLADLKHLDLDSTSLKEVYLLGERCEEKGEDAAHDALNMQCAELIAELRGVNKKNNPLPCFVFFEQQTTSLVFQKTDLSAKVKESINFIAYNNYEIWAQKVFVGLHGVRRGQTATAQNFPFNKLGEGEVLDMNLDRHIHLVVLGMSKMGMALALEAARVCHYPNFSASQMKAEYGNEAERKAGLREMNYRRTRITIVDKCAKQLEQYFKSRYPDLYEFCRWKSVGESSWHEPLRKDKMSGTYTDVEFEFIQSEFESDFVRQYLVETIDNRYALVTIAACLNDSNASLETLMCLPLGDEQLKKVNLLSYQPIASSLVDVLSNEDSHHIIPFGKIADTIDRKYLDSLEKRAKYINHLWMHKGLEKQVFEQASIDLAWRKLKESKRWASRYQAAALLHRIKWTDCSLSGVSSLHSENMQEFDGVMERTEHNRWIIEQLLLSQKPQMVACRECVANGSDFLFDKRLTYRQLHDESKDQRNPFKAELYQQLLQTKTNDQLMIESIPLIYKSGDC